MEQKIHHSRNVKRFREMLGIKKEALAYDLDEGLESKEDFYAETKGCN